MLNVNRNSDYLSNQNSDMSIGSRVREARKNANLTQQQLANKVGIKQSTLSELENGDSAGTAYIATMAAALGVNPLWLETGKGPKKATPSSNPIPLDISGAPLMPKDVIELMTLFSESNATWRGRIIDLARVGATNSKTEEAQEGGEQN